jgi:hypothetical protein
METNTTWRFIHLKADHEWLSNRGLETLEVVETFFSATETNITPI